MIGEGGYTIPWLHLTQLNVPTNYDIAGLSLGDVKQTMSNSTDKATSPVNNTLSAAGHAVGSAVGSVPSFVTHVIGSTGTDVTSVGLQPLRTQAPHAE
jgi:hypothetical protein